MRRMLGSVLALIAASAQAADERSWAAYRDDDIAMLSWAVPESDDVVLQFRCKRGSRTLQIESYLETKGLRNGAKTTLSLRTGTQKLVLEGVGSGNEMTDNVDVFTETKNDAPLAALFRAGPTLTIDVKGASEKVPLAGAAEKFDDLLRACGELAAK